MNALFLCHQNVCCRRRFKTSVLVLHPNSKKYKYIISLVNVIRFGDAGKEKGIHSFSNNMCKEIYAATFKKLSRYFFAKATIIRKTFFIYKFIHFIRKECRTLLSAACILLVHKKHC